jgi:hypothetical protein
MGIEPTTSCLQIWSNVRSQSVDVEVAGLRGDPPTSVGGHGRPGLMSNVDVRGQGSSDGSPHPYGSAGDGSVGLVPVAPRPSGKYRAGLQKYEHSFPALTAVSRSTSLSASARVGTTATMVKACAGSDAQASCRTTAWSMTFRSMVTEEYSRTALKLRLIGRRWHGLFRVVVPRSGTAPGCLPSPAPPRPAARGER